MNVLLLAAGYATRLLHVRELLPKALLPVNGKPLLAKWLNEAISVADGDVFVNTSYKADAISTFLKKSYPKVKVVNESVPVGTLTTLLTLNRDPSSWIVVHADGVTQNILDDFASICLQTPHLPRVAVFRAKKSDGVGLVEIENGGSSPIKSIRQKVPGLGAGWANAGIFYFPHDFLSTLNIVVESGSPLDITEDLLVPYINMFYPFFIEAPFEDIGLPSSYFATLCEEEYRWLYRAVINDEN